MQPRATPPAASDPLCAHFVAWWASVLAGSVDHPHLIWGQHVRAHFDDDTLVLTGQVASEHDRAEIENEVTSLLGNTAIDLRNDLAVAPERRGEPGLLTQTLLSVFPSVAMARLAASSLTRHARVCPIVMNLFASAEGSALPEVRAAVRGLLTEAYWPVVERALAKGQAILVVTIDETEAFQAREVLDQETGSLETITLPPEPYRTVERVRPVLVPDDQKCARLPPRSASQRTPSPQTAPPAWEGDPR